MSTHRYEYAALRRAGVEVGIVRSNAPDVLATHIDVLAMRHRPHDCRVVVSDDQGTLRALDEEMDDLFPARAYDEQGLDWQSFALTTGVKPA
jgi:hypothetical protein